ncbi:MAG: IS630 family transposase [Deltaproteobacteria bacterium]|nr:IS630 family transposase [Deltaproteobacteria bacterium]
MEKIDARTLNQEAQEALRNQIVRLRKAGRSHKEIADIVGVTQSHCSRVWTRYQKGGASSVAKGKRGRRQGEQRNLSAEQEAEIKRLIIDKAPNQLKLSFALWTRDAVRLLIEQRCGFSMPIRTVGEYLKRWGFTPQKPAKWAKEQSTPAVASWLLKEYPAIEKRAKQEKAEIYWGDETGIQTGANVERGYSPKGKTPMLRQTARKDRINMISAITNQGKVRFMFYKETMNSKRLITFMGRLIKDAGRKVFLILDNLKVHHSRAVADWLEKHKNKIEVFYLPSYSPELNPDEYLNNSLKGRVHSGVRAQNAKQLESKARKHMRHLQNNRSKVKKFFEHPCAAYAA